MDIQSPLSLATERAGGVAEMARRLGITSQAVSQWQRCPAERVLAVEAASGVSRHDLRPDLYPRDAPAALPPSVESDAA